MRKISLFLLLVIIRLSVYSQESPLQKALKPQFQNSFKAVPVVKEIQDVNQKFTQDYEGHMSKGQILIDEGRFKQAILHFKKAKRIYDHYEGRNDDDLDSKYKNPYPDYYLGICFNGLGEYDSSLYYIDQSLAKVPFFMEAFAYKGLILMNKGQIKEAEDHFRKGLKNQNDSEVLRHNIALCQFFKGKKKKALESLKENNALNPEYIPSYFLRGYILEITNQLEEAERVFGIPIENQEDNIDAYNGRAYFYARTEQIDKAKKDLEMICEKFPENVDAHFDLVKLNFISENYQEGIQTLINFAKQSEFFEGNLMDPLRDYPKYELKLLIHKCVKDTLKEEEVDLIAYLLNDEYQIGEKKSRIEAEKYLVSSSNSEIAKRVLLYSKISFYDELDSVLLNDLYSNYDISSIQYLYALNLFFNNQYFDAIMEFEKLIKKERNFVNAYYYKGKAHYEQNDLLGGLSEFEKGLEFIPDSPDLLFEKALCYHGLKDYRNAIDFYRDVLEVSEYNGWPDINIGNCYSKLEQFDSALIFFTRAIEINDKIPLAYKNRSEIYWEMEEYEKAIQDLNIAIELNPNYTEAINQRGDIYYESQNFIKALDDYNKCIEMKTNWPYFYRDRGNTFLRLEKNLKAISDFKKAVELKPDYDYAVSRIGDAFMRLEMYDSARYYHLKASEMDQNWYWPQYQLAYSYYYVENYDSAIVHFKKAAEIDSTSASSLGNLGWSYFLVGEYDSCIYYSDKCISIDENVFFAKANKALATLCKGETEKARELYKSCIYEAKQRGDNVDGAKEDLINLIEKGQFVDESNQIIKDYF